MFNNRLIYNHLMKACLAAVIAIGLAACSSSDNGSDTSMPTPTEPTEPMPDLAAERADINAKITAANTAVTGLTDDASDAAIGAAETAVGTAKAAVTASSVPDEEKSAFNTAIAAIEGSLGAKKTSIMAAREDAADMMRKANAATGKALHAALGGPAAGGNALANNEASSLAAAGLTVNAAAGAGSLPAASDPGAVILQAGTSAGSLGDWAGTNYALTSGTGDSKVTNEARVYTNQGAADTEPFGDVHTVGAADATGADRPGYVTLDATNAVTLGRIMAALFTHSGTQNHPTPERSDALYVRGTYDGAPGEYRCEGTCTSTNDGKGSPSALGGVWHFKPDAGAMVSQPDADYLYFGWWVSKDSDDVPTAASAFTGVIGTIAALTDDPVSAVTGSATYAGKAAGKFAMSNPLDGTGSGGHFTADAALTATFGTNDAPNNGGVSGTIDNFRLNDGSEDPGWSVALNRAQWGTLGAFTSTADATNTIADGTVWSINDNPAAESGVWSGQMYDELPGTAPDGDGSNIPTSVTGTFYSEFSTIGRMAGAFGASKE